MSIETLLSELTTAVKELTATIREANASPNYAPAEYTPDVEMPTLVDLPDVGADPAPTPEPSAEPMSKEDFHKSLVLFGAEYKAAFGTASREHFDGVLASFGLADVASITPEQRHPLIDAIKNHLEANND